MTKKLLSVISIILIFVFALSGCVKKEAETFSDVEKNEAQVLGDGENAFYLKVILEGEVELIYEIHTDEETVGDALLSLGLIEGEEGPYGLYIKEVAGFRADYEEDETYWAFYVNGEYAQKGVDDTKIESEAEYVLKVEK